MDKKACLLIIFALLLPSCSFFQKENSLSSSSEDKVEILLQANPHYTVVSQNPVFVEPGSSASFSVSFAEHYSFDSTSHEATYDQQSSLVTFSDCQYSKTVSLPVVEDPKYTFSISDEVGGTVTSSVPSGLFYAGSKITLRIDPGEHQFLYWSSSEKEDDRKNATPVAFSQEYSFVLTKNTYIYTNYYEAKAGTFLFWYDGNGGLTSEGKNGFFFEHHLVGYHTRINTLIAPLYFVKERATFCGWNTQADGSGEMVGSGWRITPQGETTTIRLYAQWKDWSPESAFRFQDIDSSSVAITGYSGGEDQAIVVIPETLSGKKVVSVKQGAFDGQNFIQEIMFPFGLSAIESQAVNNCSGLTKILFFDDLATVYDDSFSACDNLQTAYVEAARQPCLIDKQVSSVLSDQIDLVMEDKKTKPRIFFMADSICASSTNTQVIMDYFSGKYEVYNLATRGTASQATIYAMLQPYLASGDIIIDANHMAWDLDEAWGSEKWNTFESNYYLASFFDLRHYDDGRKENFFSRFVEFQAKRNKLTPESYESLVEDEVSKTNGDIKFAFVGSGEGKDPESHADSNVPYFDLRGTKEGCQYMANFYNKITPLGVRMYKVSVLWNKYAIDPNQNTDAHRQTLVDFLKGVLPYPLISTLSDYEATGQYFALSDDSHLSFLGAKLHSQLVAKDIETQLKKEGVL